MTTRVLGLVTSTCTRACAGGLGFDLALGQFAVRPVVDPDLHADDPVGRQALGQGVIDIRLEGCQRDGTKADVFGAAHLVPAEAAGELDLAALCAGGHGGLGLHLHHAAEAGTLLQLLGDRLADQLGVEVGVVDLDTVARDVTAGQALKLGGQGVDLGALGADDQAGPGGLDDDLQLLAGPLDVDVADRGVRGLTVEAVIAELADLLVLNEQLGVERLGRVPAALVGLGDADSEAEWMNFLSHELVSVTGRNARVYVPRRWPRS